uniref:60S acidic ribosomal protein P0 n=1 Tax=Coccolithus braarudii TaxID=221442 RepID=A0A7S0LTJ6_9EUKA|mmetsp:Transcript_5500/g.12131  ORF Transcript_5500/g.12131 Transcript_5500/m.12131 type:complete len:317 (+) Transcript_5500:110-1060(+)|eukprot:CAMPEP_0183356102 /NCGR_PEP_ID=MMETSP0164_2-20130417/43088_1 /TAXON_ID=221442 /ORGANISM="Coccolithus pelagicus ssp braarudi, Strain PLY182g" /LENGTH=316 /DNA_ID=CAMNT_0025529409 /DNA_START=99 /DNA_END=1049 /DNA_ORIENTATION=+
MVHDIPARKIAYKERMEGYLDEYKNILLINVDMVGSKQMQQVRIALRGRALILMGKNTIMRKVIRDNLEKKPDLEKLLPFLVGNIGLLFTNEDLNQIRQEVESNKVPAGARTGLLSPIDVFIPPGPTGLDPGQTSFFQALNIGTKIVRGSIEIITRVHLVRKGERVSPSAVSLLNKMNLKPFFFSITVQQVYENGSMYAAEVLDLTDADLLSKFFRGITKLASLSLQIGLPNLATLPHSLARGLKKLIAIAVETDITFKEAEPFKEYLADPAAYAAKHGITAGPAKTEDKADDAAAAAPEPEEEESEEECGFDLFD